MEIQSLTSNEEVLNYLLHESNQPYIISDSKTYLVFPIKSFCISLLFKLPKDLKDLDINNLDPFKGLPCEQIILSKYNYVDSEEGERKPQGKGSFSSIMYFQSLSLLQSVFDFLNMNKDGALVDSSDFLNSIETEYRFHKDSKINCLSKSNLPHYEFRIKIPSEEIFWHIDFLSFIIQKFEFFTESPNFTYQWRRSDRDIRIPDLKKIQILTTNTKTRRLGYFKLVADFLGKHRMVPERVFNRKFEELADPDKLKLEEYKFPKGLIDKTKNGISARPYTKLAIDLGFLNFLNGVYTPGKYFKVYIQLKNEFEDSDGNTGRNFFELSLFEKFFFAEELLKKDYFYFSSLLEIIFILKSTSTGELYKIFQDYILHKISNVRKLQSFAGDMSLHEKLILESLERRIKNWKKPDVYLEHILMPRIHWLADLSLIDINGRNYVITEMGEKFLEGISCLYGLHAKIFSDSASHLERHAIRILDAAGMRPSSSNNKVSFQKVEKGKIADLIRLYIDESFEHFRTLAPNRVTASQAFNYTKYKLYFKDDLKVEYSDILDFIKDDLKEHYVVQMHPYYHDGYIQRK